MTADEILASEVGRKAVEAAWKASSSLTAEEFNDTAGIPEAIRAALAVLLDPTCPTCKGGGYVPNSIYHPEQALDGPELPCPDCKGTGKRPGRLMPADERRDEIVEALKYAGPNEDVWRPHRAPSEFVERLP